MLSDAFQNGLRVEVSPYHQYTVLIQWGHHFENLELFGRGLRIIVKV